MVGDETSKNIQIGIDDDGMKMGIEDRSWKAGGGSEIKNIGDISEFRASDPDDDTRP